MAVWFLREPFYVCVFEQVLNNKLYIYIYIYKAGYFFLVRLVERADRIMKRWSKEKWSIEAGSWAQTLNTRTKKNINVINYDKQHCFCCFLFAVISTHITHTHKTNSSVANHCSRHSFISWCELALRPKYKPHYIFTNRTLFAKFQQTWLHRHCWDRLQAASIKRDGNDILPKWNSLSCLFN